MFLASVRALMRNQSLENSTVVLSDCTHVIAEFQNRPHSESVSEIVHETECDLRRRHLRQASELQMNMIRQNRGASQEQSMPVRNPAQSVPINHQSLLLNVSPASRVAQHQTNSVPILSMCSAPRLRKIDSKRNGSNNALCQSRSCFYVLTLSRDRSAG